MVEQKYLLYKESRISYIQLGNGPRVAVCFHGYGEEAGTFTFLGKYAGEQYTFISIDLPFHGNTEWNDGLEFSNEDLTQIINLIFKDAQLMTHSPSTRSGHRSRLTLMGFSLGGRIALTLFQLMQDRIEKIILFAPDGLKVNAWYWLATQSWMGNKFFAFTMRYPGWFFAFLKLLNKLGMVNASIFKFVNYYIGDKKVRQLLYNRWTSLRKLKPDISQIRSLLRKNNCKVNLVYGKHDRIILPRVGERFRKGIEEYCEISVFHSGHQVLHEKHISEILPLLQD